VLLNFAFRLSGKITEEADIFVHVLECMDHNDADNLNLWVCLLWYVFSPIYSCEQLVTERYQPPSYKPGALSISSVPPSEFKWLLSAREAQ